MLGGGSLAVLVAACSTTKGSNQAAEKDKLKELLAEKKYKEKRIEIGDNYYSPKETTIESGTIVTWENIGRSLHDVMWDESGEGQNSSEASTKPSKQDFSSETLKVGDIHVALFETPGTYFYHCHFHGGPQRGQWGSIKVNSTDRTP